MSLTLMLVSLIVTILLALHVYLRYSRWGRLLAKIPGNRQWPIFGHFFELASMDAETSFKLPRQWCKQYGRIYSMKVFGVAAVNICHPNDIETIYSSTTFIYKGVPYEILKNWICEGLLTSTGEKWKQRRKMLTPAFHLSALKRYNPIFNEQTKAFLERVKKEAGTGRTDLRPLITEFTLNTMIETSMGLSVKGQETFLKKYCKSMHELGNVLMQRYFTVVYHVKFIYNLTNLSKEENRHLENLHGLTRRIIDERKCYRENNKVTKFNDDDDKIYTGKQRLAMLDLLLEEEKAGNIDIKGIREEVDTFLFEGHDTTSSALSFCIMRIANEPKVQEKIFEELQLIFGDSNRPSTLSDLNQMKYLECCIKESLRIYPSVFVMARTNCEDVELAGYTVPAGTIIHVHIYDLHHDPKIYPDPEKFDPDRFLPEVAATRHPFAYIPFSGGPRNCIGQKFAMMEMKSLLSGLLRHYHLDPITKPEDVVLVTDIVLRSKDPMYVRFRPRKNAV